ERRVLPGGNLLRDRLAERLPAIDPAFDGELVFAERGAGERGAPAVVAERRHRRLVPRARARAPPEQHRGDRVVSVGKHIRLDRDVLADGALGRDPSLVDVRRDVFDYDTAL